MRQAVNAHCCWGVSGLGPAHGTSGVPQIGPGGGSACATPASPQKAAAIAKPSAASAKRRCLIMVPPFPPDGRGRYTGPTTTRSAFASAHSLVSVWCAGVARRPRSIPGPCFGFGSAAPAAAHRSTCRTSSATPCAGRCMCTTPANIQALSGHVERSAPHCIWGIERIASLRAGRPISHPPLTFSAKP